MYQTPLSSAPFWSGVIDQPSVTTVTAARKPPSYRRELNEDMEAPFSATNEDLHLTIARFLGAAASLYFVQRSDCGSKNETLAFLE